MGLDLSRIKNLVSKATEEAAKIELEARQKHEAQRQLDEDRKEQRRLGNHREVDEIIEALQSKIERATEKGYRSLRFLSIRGEELLSEPKNLLFRDFVHVYFGQHATRKTSISSGYRPQCLPDYARKLFNYCKKSGLTTVIQTSHVIGGIGDTPWWRMSYFEIVVYW